MKREMSFHRSSPSLLLQSIQNKLWGAILVLTFMSEWKGFVRCYKARILPCVHKEAV